MRNPMRRYGRPRGHIYASWQDLPAKTNPSKTRQAPFSPQRRIGTSTCEPGVARAAEEPKTPATSTPPTHITRTKTPKRGIQSPPYVHHAPLLRPLARPHPGHFLASWAEQARPATGGRIMRTETLHLTLAFLATSTWKPPRNSSTPPRAPPRTRQPDPRPVRRLQPPAHPLGRPSRTPDDLQAVHDGLWLWLSGYGVQAPAQPFRPHVTLLRDIDPAKAPEAAPNR